MVKKKFFFSYLSICLGALLACSTGFSKKSNKQERGGNSNLYNSIDTTQEPQTPGSDVSTLKIRSDQKAVYKKTKENIENTKLESEIINETENNYYYSDHYVFDSSIYENHMVIKNVQEELNQRGFVAGTPDGVLGPRTHDAITKFQKNHGLKASGLLNQQTLDALELELIPAEVIEENDQLYSE